MCDVTSILWHHCRVFTVPPSWYVTKPKKQYVCICSHSNTPVDELLGKPYQDEMLALIESYQGTKSNGHSDPPDDLTHMDDQNENKEFVK